MRYSPCLMAFTRPLSLAKNIKAIFGSLAALLRICPPSKSGSFSAALGAILLIGLILGTPMASAGERLFDETDLFAETADHEAPAAAEDPQPEKAAGLLPAQWLVTANTAYADVILDYDENITTKALDQLLFRKTGQIETGKIYISGLFKASYLGEWTNTDSAFPILTRFPDHSGTSAHRFFIDQAAFALTATPADWLTLYAQLEYHEVRFETQDAVQLRKAYATIGDLNRAPFYLTVGRKTINFGDFDLYNPFTQSINNHFFRAESDGVIAELGYTSKYINLTATAITGGRHLRTADTAENDQINNFALDGEVMIPVYDGTILKLGGGYLHGTIYNHTLPHHPGPEIDCPVTPGASGVPRCRGRNAAFDLRAELNSKSFDLMAEYTATFDPWPATVQNLKAFTVQGRYKTEIRDMKTHFSLSYSFSDIGPFSMGGPGSPVFDSIDQWIAGMELFVNPNFSIGLEYSHNTGFAPLVNITSTAKDAESDQLVLGGRIIF